MKGLKKSIRNFFGTTRAQTNGFIGLLVVITVAVFSQPLTRWWVSTRPQNFSAEAAWLDSLAKNWPVTVEAQDAGAEKQTAITYFDFDPNEASDAELQSLGFSGKLASRLINYRNKGGRFRIKSDLLKMYGMDSALYTSLVPYIDLPETYTRPEFERKVFASHQPYEKETRPKFNLNEADTLQLEALYGIGPALARRIVKYRDRLGGFISYEQLHEVYRLDSAVIEKITGASYLPEPAVVKKINLNTADEQMLAAHPYFGRKIARAVVAYRFQHGNFKSVDELGRISLIEKNKLDKLIPYLTVDP